MSLIRRRLREFVAIGLAVCCISAGAQPSKLAPQPPRPGPQANAKCDSEPDALLRVRCAKVLRVGVRTGYKPFGFQEAGTLRGFEIDLARQVAESMGLRPEYVAVTPGDRMAMLREGRIDVIIATTGHTLQRDQEALFVRPHYYQSQTIVLGRRDLEVSGLLKLRGNTVCVPVGSSTNAALILNGAKLTIFDTPTRLVDELRSGRCPLVAHDNSFFEPYLQQAEFAALYETKFGFESLPWSMVVSRSDGARLATVLGLSVRQMHISGELQALAKKYKVGTQFLDQQQGVWSSAQCSQISSLTDTACVIAPPDNQLEPTPFAPLLESAEKFVQQTTGLPLTLAMLKTEVAIRLLAEGMGFSLLLVVGAVVATWAFALAFGKALSSDKRWLSWPARGLLWPLQSSPLMLLAVMAGLLVSASGARSPIAALLAAIVMLGLYCGASAGLAVAQAMAQLRIERMPAKPALSSAVFRARSRVARAMSLAALVSPVASVLGVPELLSAMTNIAAFSSERITTYTLQLIFYIAVVALAQRLVYRWQNRLALNGKAYA